LKIFSCRLILPSITFCLIMHVWQFRGFAWGRLSALLELVGIISLAYADALSTDWPKDKRGTISGVAASSLFTSFALG
jgi:hypothetical protein